MVCSSAGGCVPYVLPFSRVVDVFRSLCSCLAGVEEQRTCERLCCVFAGVFGVGVERVVCVGKVGGGEEEEKMVVSERGIYSVGLGLEAAAYNRNVQQILPLNPSFGLCLCRAVHLRHSFAAVLSLPGGVCEEMERCSKKYRAWHFDPRGVLCC